MDYNQALEYWSSTLRFGIRPGLHRMYRLMELLDHPEARLRCIHIAGTNGKGSAASYCSAILAAAGRRVGLFISPHLVRLTERIRIIEGVGGLQSLLADETAGEISPDDFAAELSRVRAAAEQMLQEGLEQPTEFELVTATAFCHFADRQCTEVVLETGLGGRLDSTNIISRPLASIITALGYDHMDRLGSTLAEIAGEKAGIIKAGCPVFLYNPGDLQLPPDDAAAAAEVIRSRCTELGASLQTVSLDELKILEYGWGGQAFSDRVSNLTLRTSLLGVFQPMNAALAARCCQYLQLATDEQIREGIRLARWPGRLEILRRDPPILLDGAHNPQCCLALSAALARLLPGQPVVFLTGMLQDKDYPEMLRIMLQTKFYQPAALVCMTPDNPRALPAGLLAEAARKAASHLPAGGKSGYNIFDAIYCTETPESGALLALQLANRQNMALCAFASLYAVGTLRRILTVQEGKPWIGSN
ncbi:MAG TPA: bifunctional folylpolyglutamate synthase/dihydrofolate synthase [Clostridiales bacterium]|nr:bifunctional folylpolyglutamate synthase/dihydrofolate synthase [Clostridiales bacterium]